MPEEVSKAEQVRRLLDEGGLTVAEIAQRVDISEGYVRTIRRMHPGRRTQIVANTERREDNQERFLEKLLECRGIVAKAATAAGLSTATPHMWMASDPTFKEEVNRIKEICIDYVEDALLDQIKAGVPASTIFFLKTRAKHRGYVERSEITGADGAPVDIRVVLPQVRMPLEEPRQLPEEIIIQADTEA